MRRHIRNAAYGALDYASYPIGMLLVAPIVLHRLGSAEYGLWMIVTSVISAGGIVASGFCDAAIQRVASLRSSNDRDSMVVAVRGLLGINLVLGCVLALFVWVAAPYAAARIGASREVPGAECLISLRIAAALILVRAVESVGVGVQRAFERYRGTVRISTAVRLLTLASAALLAASGHRTQSILILTAVFLLAGTSLQLRQARALLGPMSLRPTFLAAETRSLLRLGVFAWMQSLGSVVFGQFDRILLGLSLGAVAVAPYALCIQFAQPIFGLTASVLHFLFPYLSGRAATLPVLALRRTLLKAFACNLAIVVTAACLLLLGGERVIQIWAGPAVARQEAEIFPTIVLGSSLMGLSVTGTYALQALGRFRTVALISLGERAVSLTLMLPLLRHWGLQGLTFARLLYGAIALLVYVPLFSAMRGTAEPAPSGSPMAMACKLQEGSNP